jgi:hypothetical protein
VITENVLRMNKMINVWIVAMLPLR